MLSRVLRTLGHWLRGIWRGQGAPDIRDTGTPPSRDWRPPSHGEEEEADPGPSNSGADGAEETEEPPARTSSPLDARGSPQRNAASCDPPSDKPPENKEEGEDGALLQANPKAPSGEVNTLVPPPPPKVPREGGNPARKTEETGARSGPIPPPRNIPGRRSTSSRIAGATDGEAREDTTQPASGHRPELICRKPPGSPYWEVALQVADDEVQVETVRQNGAALAQVNGEWPLESFAGGLSVAAKDGMSIAVPLVNEAPLVFKLKSDWSGDGRHVRHMTNGHFIVVAPSNWTREGHVPVAPEACSDSGFLAHFFFRDGSESDEEAGGFPGHEIALTASPFKLDGQRVFDDSEEGDLFVGEPPLLDASPGVGWARVGEEQKDGWSGENFMPATTALAEVLDGRQGRFFIRVYDAQARLLDSCQFRLLRELRQILVNETPYTPQTLFVPPPSGHPATKVRFVGAGGAAITPILPFDAVDANEVEGVVVIDPDPDADHVSCVLEADGGCVDIVLNLPRIWWRLQQADETANEWRDSEMTMTRHEFRERADRNVVVQLRVPKTVRSTAIGFGDDVDRTYPGKRNGERNHVELPLADFVDYTQIDQRLAADAPFSVRFDLSGKEPRSKTLSLIRVQADPAPEIVRFRSSEQAVAAGDSVTLRWTTRRTQHVRAVLEPDIGPVEPNGELDVTPSETTTYTLRLTARSMEDVTRQVTVRVHHHDMEVPESTARVRRAQGGWRSGKGFSDCELRAAGLTRTTARRSSIRLDERRRSLHSINVETLGRLTNA